MTGIAKSLLPQLRVLLLLVMYCTYCMYVAEQLWDFFLPLQWNEQDS
jgi:hypothetical protein